MCCCIETQERLNPPYSLNKYVLTEGLIIVPAFLDSPFMLQASYHDSRMEVASSDSVYAELFLNATARLSIHSEQASGLETPRNLRSLAKRNSSRTLTLCN